MADVTIEAAASASFSYRAVRGGVFWTSPTVGYVIYLNVNDDLVYRKTADGGATWGNATEIVAAASCDALAYDCWADWQTEGDAGTKIHIAYMSLDTGEVRYVYLDTSDDSVGGDDLIETCQGTGTFLDVTAFQRHMVSITKTRGGNLAVAIKYYDSNQATFNSFYTSPDADTWTSKTNPYEQPEDYCLLFPGNEADNQDLWGVYWDVSADEISLKTFDDSGNSWGEQSISGSMAENASFLQMAGAIRLSDGHLILAAWNMIDNAAADLMTWDINGAGSITAKTNVLTNSAESFLVSVFINQANDDIYIAYAKGTTAFSLVAAFYQKSIDGGANWGGQTALQADAEDDERGIYCGAVKAAWGGKFQPVWFNNDLFDIFTNTDNGISIAAAGGGPAAESSPVAVVASVVSAGISGSGSVLLTAASLASTLSIKAGAVSGAGVAPLTSAIVAIASSLKNASISGSGNASLTGSAVSMASAVKSGGIAGIGYGTLTGSPIIVAPFVQNATIKKAGNIIAHAQAALKLVIHF